MRARASGHRRRRARTPDDTLLSSSAPIRAHVIRGLMAMPSHAHAHTQQHASKSLSFCLCVDMRTTLPVVSRASRGTSDCPQAGVCLCSLSCNLGQLQPVWHRVDGPGPITVKCGCGPAHATSSPNGSPIAPMLPGPSPWPSQGQGREAVPLRRWVVPRRWVSWSCDSPAESGAAPRGCHHELRSRRRSHHPVAAVAPLAPSLSPRGYNNPCSALSVVRALHIV